MALKRIGALWKKEAKGEGKKDFLSGTIDLGALGEARIMVFENEKTEAKQPDYVIQLVIDDEESKPASK